MLVSLIQATISALVEVAEAHLRGPTPVGFDVPQSISRLSADTIVFSCVHTPTFALHAACEQKRDIPGRGPFLWLYYRFQKL